MAVLGEGVCGGGAVEGEEKLPMVEVGAVALPAVVWMLRVPERWPVAEGLKRTLRKQVRRG